LKSEADIRVLTKAVELVRQLANTPKFLELNGGEMVPGEGADIATFIRKSKHDDLASGRNLSHRARP
jgi:choline dehydrogenase